MNESELLKNFMKEVSGCLLLEDDEKKYWLEKGKSLPYELLKSIRDSIKNKNDLMDRYILAAVKEDPILLTELKNKINRIKKDALVAEELASSPGAEEALKQQLEKI